MLKLNANIKNAEQAFSNIDFTTSSCVVSGDTYIITFTAEGSHGLTEGDFIRLTRTDGPYIDYVKDYSVTIIDTNNFSIEIPRYTTLYFSKIGKIYLNENPNIHDTNLYMFLECLDGFPHNMVENRENIKLVENILEGEYPKEVCPNEYFLYNGMFLYKGNDFTTFSNLSRKLFIEGQQGYYEVKIPYLESNRDNPSLMLITGLEEEDYEELYELTNNSKVYCINEMFFNEEQNKLQDGVSIQKRNVILKTSVGFIEGFDFDKSGRDSNTIFSEGIEINSAVDYEKQIFYPCFVNESGETANIDKILFKLHFRDRYYGGSLKKSWDTDDTKYWMRYNSVVNNRLKPESSEKTQDTMADLGFVNDDILYRRNILTKSFIRLLFYDTNDIRTQSLLAYYSVPFDTNKMYTEITSESGTTVENIEPNIEINGEENGFSGEEGFNLHLYPSILEGKAEETLYLRVEFNHAKYGKTLKMIFPTDEDGNLLNFEDEQFPITYYNGNRVELDKFMKDMYLKIKIKYDYENNRYLWYPENATYKNNEIIFEAFEPRVNG